MKARINENANHMKNNFKKILNIVLLSNFISVAQQGDLGLETEMLVCDRKGFSHRRCR